MSNPYINGVNAEDRRAIETLYRAFSEGAVALLDEVLAPDWQDIPLGSHQAGGRDGIKPVISQFRSAFSNLSINVHEMIGVPGRVAVRAEIIGVHTGIWFDVPATGKSFSIPIHEFHHLDSGVITHTWHLEDWLGWFAQVGASPV